MTKVSPAPLLAELDAKRGRMIQAMLAVSTLLPGMPGGEQRGWGEP